MGSPLGDFIRAKRDSLRPEDLGLPPRDRRRVPGLRRSELADRAGISVEYLTRIEQGRDRHPSTSVIHALSDALSLDSAERAHVRHLAKATSGECAAHVGAAPSREVRPAVRDLLGMLEPGVALLTNRLGDVLAHTTGFELVMRQTGLLDGDSPNLTRYVFTDPRAKRAFVDWDQVADEQAFDLWLCPPRAGVDRFRAELAQVAEFTRRRDQVVPPARGALRLDHPAAGLMRWNREVMELSGEDARQIVVFLPADEQTAAAFDRLRRESGGALRAV
ncbi:helix-turn-helix domain-containing protein [Amycolatopsis alkalitolerans]|uniref:Helix-turn-helix transcriptional regulator n=1 Tax=Amycolatopsis alkalitolerans TaxID=2547244 RepID=A0A5C4M269_9PSEU|nr:helix-turn-helix transcriptional regulator [Amycolatopsis alkalitolerans]TNC26998.1 helix-turn-helix transcriptional regulator [Amycolatopsis alkalitolerans]